MVANIDPHEGHEQHLCHLHNIEQLLTKDPETYKRLVRNPKYICMGCGRVAANEENLCAPRPLD